MFRVPISSHFTGFVAARVLWVLKVGAGATPGYQPALTRM